MCGNEIRKVEMCDFIGTEWKYSLEQRERLGFVEESSGFGCDLIIAWDG